MWTPEEKDAFMEMLTNTANMYDRKLGSDTLLFYCDILQDEVTFEQAARALRAHIVSGAKDSSFFPKPGDLKRLAVGQPDDQVEQAWHETMTAIERIGPYQSVSFRDPIINSVIAELGGWVHLCELSGDAMQFKAHEFRRLYRLAIQTRRATKVHHLPGRNEIASETTCFRNEDAYKVALVGREPQHSALNFLPRGDVGLLAGVLPRPIGGRLFLPPAEETTGEGDMVSGEEDIADAEWLEG